MDTNNEILCELKIDEKSHTKLHFGSYGSIDLTVDNQEGVKELFTSLLAKIVKENIMLKLSDKISKDVRPLLIEISKEYISQLMGEINWIKEKYESRFIMDEKKG
jgi:hypothetical protein